MKLSIRNDTNKTEPSMEFYLRQYTNGSVELRGEDNEGANWAILSINPDGTFCRCSDISPSSGLHVNEFGQIVERS